MSMRYAETQRVTAHEIVHFINRPNSIHDSPTSDSNLLILKCTLYGNSGHINGQDDFGGLLVPLGQAGTCAGAEVTVASLTCVRSVDSRSSTLPRQVPRARTHARPEALRRSRRCGPAQILREPLRRCLETRA